MAGLTIGKFAAAEGVGVETVRFYQRRGLLAVPQTGFTDDIIRGDLGIRGQAQADLRLNTARHHL